MAIGDIITAARYNNLQSRVATVMGTGSGDDGYGQTLNSAQVAASATVNATDMSTLYTDIANGRVHQTGVTPTEIAIISQSDVVLDSDTINKSNRKHITNSRNHNNRTGSKNINNGRNNFLVMINK